MKKLLLVAWREYWFNLRRRSFLFAAFGAPLLTIGLMTLVFTFIIGGEEDAEGLGTIGYVDNSGVLAQALEKPDYFTVYASDEEAQAALDAGAIGGYFVVPRNYMAVGAVRFFSTEGMPAALRNAFDSFLVANLTAQTDGLRLPSERVIDPVDLTVIGLDTGREITGAAFSGLFLVPFIFVLVFMMASQVTSGFLMSGVVEEKVNRIMEVLVTSVTPLQMLLGKVIGLGALGLTQFFIWIVGGFIMVGLGDRFNISALSGIEIPVDMTIIGLIYFLLSYFFVGTLMAGIGVTAGSEQESRQFSGIFSLLFVIPFFFVAQFIQDSNGALPVALSMIPFTAAPSMLLRFAFGTVPMWQIALSMGLLLVTGLVVAFASARVFRWGLLMYGKRPTPRELWRVITSSSGYATSVAKADESIGR
ncbi:MAG: ABC transporter permease [Anaerolineae bacterium]